MKSEPIGWLNTGLPLLILAVLALVLPRLFVSAQSRSQRDVFLSVTASAVCLLLSGMAIFALIYAYLGVAVWPALSAALVATSLFFLRLSAMAALLWAPILALVWFTMAQAVETRRGEDIMRGSS